MLEIFKVGIGDSELPDFFRSIYCNLAGFDILYHHGNLCGHISELYIKSERILTADGSGLTRINADEGGRYLRLGCLLLQEVTD
jgi:hypothetical protein